MKQINFNIERYKPENTPIRALVYGNTGTGKTLFASTFPKPFFFDINRGGKTIEDTGIPHLKIELPTKENQEPVYKKIVEALYKIRAKEAPFDFEIKTIVFDDLTDLGDALLTEVMLEPKRDKRGAIQAGRSPTDVKPEWDDYNLVFNRLTQSILKIAKDIGVNVIGLAGVDLETTEDGVILGACPMIVGKSRKKIGYHFDEYLYFDIKGTKDAREYICYTQKYSYYYAKTRTRKDGKALPFMIKDPSYQKIYE